MQTQDSEISGYQKQIHSATGAPLEILPILERIMREEIFHSTLDWQSARQFRQGARKAFDVYRGDAAFYDAEQAIFAARWNTVVLGRQLEAARESSSAEAIAEAERNLRDAQIAEQKAGRTFDQFLSPSCRTY